jgi:hypothetical protein
MDECPECGFFLWINALCPNGLASGEEAIGLFHPVKREYGNV